jgi:hypothetical protein
VGGIQKRIPSYWFWQREVEMLCQVFLMDLLGELPQPKKTTIESRLRLHFTQVATTGGNKDTVIVGWPTGIPNVAPTDLLVYYLANSYTLQKREEAPGRSAP